MRSIIIPAAGLATRMKPLSRGVSKAMIPVNGRPLISYVIEKILQEPDVAEIVIVENELCDISEFVARVYPDSDIKCVIQNEKLGPLHAIQCGMNAVEHEDSSITIWLGDTICLEDFDYSIDFLATSPVDDPHRWCIIGNDGTLYDKVEHPPISEYNALIGVYNFVNRRLFDDSMDESMRSPDRRGEYQIAFLIDEYSKHAGCMNQSQTQEWYDCGELNTYYESKARLLKKTARSFNDITVDTFTSVLTKTTKAENKEKIQKEKTWFNSLDETQKLFCPRILDSEYGVLKMTLEPGTALNEVLAYDNLRPDIWNGIIRKILRVHHEVFMKDGPQLLNHKIAEECFDAYFVRLQKRMTQLEDSFLGEPLEFKAIKDFLTDTALDLCKDPVWSNVIHGDSHLGNIIYDPYNGGIKFVDPRGAFTDASNDISGDLRYDMAKLLQDFYCGYAMIIAGRYHWEGQEFFINWVDGSDRLLSFLEDELAHYGYDVTLLKRLSVYLLIMAVPFHADSPLRQRAMFDRGLQLIKELTK